MGTSLAKSLLILFCFLYATSRAKQVPAPDEAEQVPETTNSKLPSEERVNKETPLYTEIDKTERKKCPACDPTVFSYCSDKLFHDSCCCNDPNNPYYPLPYECAYADCSFLHANSCYEHKLITACCCTNNNYNNPYRPYDPYYEKKPVSLIL